MVDDLWPQELARYQLVTPNAGSVVLETQAQYDKHGLKQDDKHGLKHGRFSDHANDANRTFRTGAFDCHASSFR